MAEQRILLVDGDANRRKSIKNMLTKLGYWVVGEAEDGLGALKMLRNRQPDLLIIHAGISGMSGLEVARIAHEDKLAPVVVISSESNVLEKAKEARVFALLFSPIDENNMLAAVELAQANYQEIIKLENEIKELREVLETRKLIERAKGILMETLRISEAEAFKRMQKQSMNKRVSMRRVAEALILAHNFKED